MTKHATTASLTLLMILAVSPGAFADPDWESMAYTTHSAFQAVDSQGGGTFPLTQPVKMRGVIVNNADEMLDIAPGANPYMGGQWQMYVQAVDAGDFGGTACWMGQNIGKMSGTHPEGSYTDAEWLAELDRLGHDPVSGHAFRRGDLIEIRARAPGLSFRGKTNVNEQHSDNPAADFDIYLLEADYGLPTPASIALADIKTAGDDFIFDSSRLTGAEFYQGSLVRIDGLTYIDAANWGPDGDLLVTDGDGRTMTVKLGVGVGFEVYPPPAEPFDVIAILDQEDTVGDDGLMDGYRLYVVNYDGNGAVLNGESCEGDLDGDGDVDLSDLATLLGNYASTTAEYPDGDMDGDGDVDLSDLAGLLARYGQVCW